MPDFDNWESMTEAAESRCSKILEKNVLPVVKKIVSKHIKEDIYGVTSPRPRAWVGGETYRRRFSLLNS